MTVPFRTSWCCGLAGGGIGVGAGELGGLGLRLSRISSTSVSRGSEFEVVGIVDAEELSRAG
jgi:hypothetical protein